MEKIPILLILLGHIWVDASQGILPVVLVKLKELFALTYFQAGLAMAVLNITSSVIQPIFGYISDRFYTGWFIPMGILWTALSMGLLGWAPSYQLSLILLGLAGLGTAAFHPRALMTVFRVSGSRRGFGVGLFSTSGNLGFALGPLVGGLLVFQLGLHATMGLLFPAVALVLLILVYPGDLLKRDTHGRTGPKTAFHRESYPIPWFSLTGVCLIVVLRSWVYMSFMTYLPMFFKNLGVDPKAGSLMLTVFLVGGAASGLYGGHLSDRIGRRRVMIASMLLFPLFMSFMLMSSGLWLWVLAGASGAALLASFSVTTVLAQELLPGHVGLASGLVLGLAFGTGGVGTALSGYIADVLGLYPTLRVLAFVPVAGALLAVMIKETWRYENGKIEGKILGRETGDHVPRKT